jgi:ADP-ribosylglycohydrolase
MLQRAEMPLRERVLGGVWEAEVGGALGVPVEFESRPTVQAKSVTGMRGYGTYHQPAGTWSDDSSTLLCRSESLVGRPFDTEDIGRRFMAWCREQLWTSRGKVFDIGHATAQALSRVVTGTPAELAGVDDANSNGNGSLMRILPVALRFAQEETALLLDRIHRASVITHRHARSRKACGLYALVMRELVAGTPPTAAFENGLLACCELYQSDPGWAEEQSHFQRLLAGGMAGVAYGKDAAPADWTTQLARRSDFGTLFARYAELR